MIDFYKGEREFRARQEALPILERACLHLVQQFRLVCGTDAGLDNITARKYLIEAMVRVQVKP